MENKAYKDGLNGTYNNPNPNPEPSKYAEFMEYHNNYQQGQSDKRTLIEVEQQKTYKHRIEQLATQWGKIKSCKDWNIWAENIRAQKFGTHGTIPIFEVIKNTEVKFHVSFVQDSFINEIKDALNGIKI